MHIVFITHEFPKQGIPHGGIGSFLKTHCNQLAKFGLIVTVLGIGNNKNTVIEDHGGFSVIRIGQPRKLKGFNSILNAFYVYSEIKKLNRQKPIDIIEGSELSFGLLPRIENVKYVVRLHGGHHFFAESENRGINKWKGFLEKRSFSKADAFIGVSDYVVSHTSKLLSFNNKPIEIINYPLDTSLFAPHSVVIRRRSILFAGTVCEKKGIRQLLMAMPLIKAVHPNLQLEVYGRDSKKEGYKSYIDFLKQTLDSSCLEGVTFHGAVLHETLPKLYASAQICVFPSHMETQGLVAPEAMLMKKPVLFTELGPGPETIVPYQTGMLCNPRSPEDIAEKLIWMLNNPVECSVMGEKARLFALKKFNEEMITVKNIEFYKSVFR